MKDIEIDFPIPDSIVRRAFDLFQESKRSSIQDWNAGEYLYWVLKAFCEKHTGRIETPTRAKIYQNEFNLAQQGAHVEVVAETNGITKVWTPGMLDALILLPGS